MCKTVRSWRAFVPVQLVYLPRAWHMEVLGRNKALRFRTQSPVFPEASDSWVFFGDDGQGRGVCYNRRTDASCLWGLALFIVSCLTSSVSDRVSNDSIFSVGVSQNFVVFPTVQSSLQPSHTMMVSESMSIPWVDLNPNPCELIWQLQPVLCSRTR